MHSICKCDAQFVIWQQQQQQQQQRQPETTRRTTFRVGPRSFLERFESYRVFPVSLKVAKSIPWNFIRLRVFTEFLPSFAPLFNRISDHELVTEFLKQRRMRIRFPTFCWWKRPVQREQTLECFFVLFCFVLFCFQPNFLVFDVNLATCFLLKTPTPVAFDDGATETDLGPWIHSSSSTPPPFGYFQTFSSRTVEDSWNASGIRWRSIFFLGPGFSNEQIFGCQRRRNETDRVFFLVLVVVVVVVVAVVEIRILNRPSQSYEEIIRVTRQMKRASILECRNSTQTLTNAFSRTINCFVVELKLSQFLTSILAENLFFF